MTEPNVAEIAQVGSAQKFRTAFVDHLDRLRDSPGAMAALRRGAARPPGTAVAMFRYVSAWQTTESPWSLSVYTVAALFAVHAQSQPRSPHLAGGPSLGAALRELAGKGAAPQGSATERRFMVLLRADQDDLPKTLHRTVTQLRGDGIRLDYVRLLSDVQNWDHENRFVQRAWARDFYSQNLTSDPGGAPAPDGSDATPTDDDENFEV